MYEFWAYRLCVGAYGRQLIAVQHGAINRPAQW